MRVHLLDGTYELFRAHYSRGPGRTDPTGRDVKATVGVVASVLRLLEDPAEQVTHLGVAFDNPIESWRNRRFAGYKDGSGVDAALRAQFDLVEEAIAALGVRVWSMAEHEADDALATAAWALQDTAEQVRVLTPDKDLGQVVTGSRVVQVDRARNREFDEDGIMARLGVVPASVPDLLALMGDAADGIPGLPGFGAKSAAALLRHYGHLEAIPDEHERWEVAIRGAARLAATLAEHRADALLYRELATLVDDLDLPVAPSDVAWSGVPAARFLSWCDELGVTSLRTRPTRWA